MKLYIVLLSIFVSIGLANTGCKHTGASQISGLELSAIHLAFSEEAPIPDLKNLGERHINQILVKSNIQLPVSIRGVKLIQ